MLIAKDEDTLLKVVASEPSHDLPLDSIGQLVNWALITCHTHAPYYRVTRLGRLLVDYIQAKRLHVQVDPGARRIVCAAMRHPVTDRLVMAPRHDHCLTQIERLYPGEETDDWVEGFVDQRMNFLGREDAHAVATFAGQLLRRVGGDDVELYSENLY